MDTDQLRGTGHLFPRKQSGTILAQIERAPFTGGIIPARGSNARWHSDKLCHPRSPLRRKFHKGRPTPLLSYVTMC